MLFTEPTGDDVVPFACGSNNHCKGCRGTCKGCDSGCKGCTGGTFVG